MTQYHSDPDELFLPDGEPHPPPTQNTSPTALHRHTSIYVKTKMIVPLRHTKPRAWRTEDRADVTGQPDTGRTSWHVAELRLGDKVLLSPRRIFNWLFYFVGAFQYSVALEEVLLGSYVPL